MFQLVVKVVFSDELHLLPPGCFLIMYLMNRVFLVLVVSYKRESSSSFLSLHIGEHYYVFTTIDQAKGLPTFVQLDLLLTFLGLTLEKFPQLPISRDEMDPCLFKRELVKRELLLSFLHGDVMQLRLFLGSPILELLNGISRVYCVYSKMSVSRFLISSHFLSFYSNIYLLMSIVSFSLCFTSANSDWKLRSRSRASSCFIFSGRLLIIVDRILQLSMKFIFDKMCIICS